MNAVLIIGCLMLVKNPRHTWLYMPLPLQSRSIFTYGWYLTQSILLRLCKKSELHRGKFQGQHQIMRHWLLRLKFCFYHASFCEPSLYWQSWNILPFSLWLSASLWSHLNRSNAYTISPFYGIFQRKFSSPSIPPSEDQIDLFSSSMINPSFF